MQQPVEVSVEEGAEIVQRVCGIDVAKASGMICTRAPHDRLAARRVTKVWEVKATTKAISELADHLAAERVERVVLESTSDYWRPFYYLLEAAGLTVWLVNARQVKNVPRRPKSDKIDAVWLAKLAERSMVSPSFVPAEAMRHVRDLARPVSIWSRTAPGSSSESRSCSKTAWSRSPRCSPIYMGCRGGP